MGYNFRDYNPNQLLLLAPNLAQTQHSCYHVSSSEDWLRCRISERDSRVQVQLKERP